MELTPEEKQHIYQEEKVRREAQEQLRREAVSPADAQAASDIQGFKGVVAGGIIAVPGLLLCLAGPAFMPLGFVLIAMGAGLSWYLVKQAIKP